MASGRIDVTEMDIIPMKRIAKDRPIKIKAEMKWLK